ncbi:type VI secretion system secreted protein VgrG [Pedobacter sp. UYP30]|uniref:type VI secretion system Vgr family protein n=1 Tax=Pedobacter sp. UYP30 TaxID=1756400 RepID=UPI00339521E1
MESKIKVEIYIDGTEIPHFSNFTLEQKFNQHHTFALRINHDQIEDEKGLSIENSKDFIGRNLSIQWGLATGEENRFMGKITKVEISQSHGFQGDILISGFSPGILLDRGPDLGSYLDKTLKNILELATKDAPSNDLHFNIKPTFTEPIDYMIQYRESDFDFINRLSAEYHEWFYYDGENLNFGKPDNLEEVKLIYGRDLHSLQYGLTVAPLNYQKFAYHSEQDQVLSADPEKSNSSSPDVSHAIKSSNMMFSKRFTEPLSVRVNTQKEINTFVNDEQKALVSELVHLMGNGDNPSVGIGKIVKISTSVKNVAVPGGSEINGIAGKVGGFMLQDFGKFLVTAVYHQLDGVGHYQNTFEGVAAETEKLPVNGAEKPYADMQLATVMDNNDPKKQGRIKVQFKWACTANDHTEWLRVMSPNAGHGDTGKNRGFLVVPEKGDQVIVAFEEGNIARPVVMGSVYHSNNVESGFTDSNIKGMSSRKGSALTFDDLNHALNMGTNAANFVNIKNGPGLMTAQAASKIVIHSGESTITMDKEGNIAITGKNISINGQTSIDIQSPKITIGNLAPAEGATPEQTAGATNTVDVKGKVIVIEGKESVENTAPQVDLGKDGDGLTNMKGKTVNVNGIDEINLNSTIINSN